MKQDKIQIEMIRTTETNKDTVHLRTKPPINFIFLCVVSLVSVGGSFSNWAWIMYLILFWLIYYPLFCRYSCVVLITSSDIRINYINPLLKSKTFKLSNIKKLDYERSGYNLFSDKKIGGPFFYPQYCYDRLIIHLNTPVNSI